MERQAMQWGYDPKKAKEEKEQRVLSERWQDDPLYGFPNDISYLTAKQVADKLEVTMQLRDKLAPQKRWDRERGTACLGRHGLAAKRCSMNDKLWSLWLKSKWKGRPLTLNQVRNLILFDIARSKLYPQGWTDDTKDPPEWYVKKLKEEGKFEVILREIEEASKG